MSNQSTVKQLKFETQSCLRAFRYLLLGGLTGSCVCLNGVAFAQQDRMPVRIHTGSSHTTSSTPSTSTSPSPALLTPIAPATENAAFDPNRGYVVPANFAEDFSVPSANNPALPTAKTASPIASPIASPATSATTPTAATTSPSATNSTLSTTATTPTAIPQSADASKASPFMTASTVKEVDVDLVSQQGMPAGPVVLADDIIIDSGITLMDGEYLVPNSGPSRMNPMQTMNPMNPMQPMNPMNPMNPMQPMNPMRRMSMPGPNIGYDPHSMQGCAPEDCRVYYANVEALYWKQEEDQSLGFSVGRQISDFDYEWGARVTVGEMFDCISGVEFVYTGPFEFNRTRLDVGAGLDSTFTGVAPFAPAAAAIDTFFNSTIHSQFLQTQMSSYEFNRRWFASDVFSTLLGLRVFEYDESFGFNSIAGDGVGQGIFRNNVDNFMIGAQFGVNMYRPLTQRFSYGFWTKVGAFGNFGRNTTLLLNRGATLANARRSDVDIAGMLQGGLGVRYRLLPRMTATAGYEYLVLGGVATVADQGTFPLSLTSPNNIDQGDSVFFHGVNAGLEFSF